jgi:hypothetical protein
MFYEFVVKYFKLIILPYMLDAARTYIKSRVTVAINKKSTTKHPFA